MSHVTVNHLCTFSELYGNENGLAALARQHNFMKQNYQEDNLINQN